jgi:hypothetical protein
MAPQLFFGAMYKNGFGLETIKDRFGNSSAAKLNAMKMHMELKFLYTAPWVFTALCIISEPTLQPESFR